MVRTKRWISTNGYLMATEQLPRLDSAPQLREKLLPFCRLQYGDVWKDKVSGHKVAVLDAENAKDIKKLVGRQKPVLAINDPPYNVVVGNKNTKALFKKNTVEYDQFSSLWLNNVLNHMAQDASFYVWLGADLKNGFHPIPEFIGLMREQTGWKPRNWITLRNQRGYGTQKNWMWIRQELLYYTRGNPPFHIEAEYTDIPKTLKGYYKEINGKRTENLERGKHDTIRAGNVWLDIQQVFYRMQENVPGCYAQKPLKSIERIIQSGSNEQDCIVDLFCHSGTTLLAGERLHRKVFTCDNDPIYAEIAIRRLERFRKEGKTGWQWHTPFPEVKAY
jgi:site-specific DNA-methyltransferase (adenine-specific)